MVDIKIKNKLFIILPLIFSFIFLHSSLVSAIGNDNVTLIVDNIRNDNILNKAMVVNISVSILASENYTHAYLYIASTSKTANTSLVKINATNGVKNITSGAGGAGVAYNISITINSSLLEDGNDYTLTANLWNGTNYFNRTATITIDNTVPVASTSLIPTSSTSNTVNFSGTVTASQTTSCTLKFLDKNPGSQTYTMVHGGDTCSYNIASVPEQSYQWYITASDESNTTDSSTQTTNVDTTSGGARGAEILLEQEPLLQPSTSSQGSGSGANIPLIVTILIFAVGAWIWFRK